jgi:branched-chain amino acid transport system permease protein
MMDVSTLIELVSGGVARGLLLALLGAGITLIFGLGNILNIAIGIFAVIAAVAAVEFSTFVPSPAIGAVLGVATAGVLGLTVDRTLLSLVYREEGEDRILLGIFVTIGLLLAIEGVMFVYYPLSYSLPHSVPELTVGSVTILGSSVAQISVAGIVLLALFLFLQRTYLGKATRTIFQDETGAVLCGIDIRQIRTLIFVISVMLAGLAGVLQSLGSSITAAGAFELTSFAIIVSIVGGVRNIRGTVAAGLLLGLVITFGNFLIGAFISKMILFGVAVLVLLLRPEEIA